MVVGYQGLKDFELGGSILVEEVKTLSSPYVSLTNPNFLIAHPSSLNSPCLCDLKPLLTFCYGK